MVGPANNQDSKTRERKNHSDHEDGQLRGLARLASWASMYDTGAPGVYPIAGGGCNSISTLS